MLSADQIAWMTAKVAQSLDVSITVKRGVLADDGYGHKTPSSLSTVGTFDVNVIKPTATQLQLFADIIGSQVGLIIRFMDTSDIREGDIIFGYLSRNWEVHNIQDAESYTFANEALIVSVQ